MDEAMRDHYDALSSIYARMANIAEDNGNQKLSDELMRKSFEFDLKANA